MSVKEEYYKMLKDGIKTVELRLLDDKRKQIMIGDAIEFHNASDDNDRFCGKVLNLYRADNFEELCKQITAKKAGFKDDKTLISILEDFYSIDKQNEIGVVGIEIMRD